MLVQDIRYALRSFLRAPGFTLVALITLALGIGGTTAIFSIVDGVLLRPLPYQDSGRILRLNRVAANGNPDSFSAADYRDVKKNASMLAAVAGYRSDIVDLTGRGEPVRITGMQTTAAFFDVFDAPPLLGPHLPRSHRSAGRGGCRDLRSDVAPAVRRRSQRDRHPGSTQRQTDRDHRRRTRILAAPAEERRVDVVAARRPHIPIRHRR